MAPTEIDGRRLWNQINSLGLIGKAPHTGGIFRPTWSTAYESAREWLIELMNDVDLDVQVDAVGNTWGRWRVGDLPALVVGSHIDTVPNGGRFDGTLGVLAAIEAIRVLKASGYKPKREIWVVSWAEEEGSSTGIGLLGSRLYAELFSPAERASVENLLSAEGHAFELSRGKLQEFVSDVEDVFAYLELHIEQGPVMARRGVQLGIVSQIVAVEGGMFHLLGVANHAGGAPMEDRADASAAVAQVILAVRDCALQAGVRATCGRVEFFPNASNVIPGAASVSLDARAVNEDEIDRYLQTLNQEVLGIGQLSSVEISYEQKYRLPAAAMDSRIQGLISSGAAELGATSMGIVSGAGHDAMALAARVPTAMIFVPSEAHGISHAPAELTKDSDCAMGATALSYVIGELASGSIL